MSKSNQINMPIAHALKILVFLVCMGNFQLANASVVTVKIEDANLLNYDPIQKLAPGFGSSGPISLNWDPYDNFFTELLAYNRGYSGGAAAWCFEGNFESCALELSVTAEDTILELKSFTLGFFGYGNNIQYSVTDLATETIVSIGSPWVNGRFTTLIDVSASSNKGFLISFGPDGYNGGINNITYSYYQSMPIPTPLPTAVWLFGSGLIGLMGVMRRARLDKSNAVKFS